jgi:hypothetical protein
MRASDADRELVVAALQRHTAAGRLTLDEYSDRVERTLQATTFADLAEVTSDLPVEVAGSATDPAHSRSLFLAFALAAVTVVVLAILLAVAR